METVKTCLVAACCGLVLLGAVAAHAGQSMNGTTVNGISSNGQGINGISSNGYSFNGLSSNGQGMNGQSINGLCTSLELVPFESSSAKLCVLAQSERLSFNSLSHSGLGKQ